MPLLTHRFIVRIWRELREVDNAPAEWRGVVEHVAESDEEKKKQAFCDLNTMTTFIAEIAQIPPPHSRWRLLTRLWRRS